MSGPTRDPKSKQSSGDLKISLRPAGLFVVAMIVFIDSVLLNTSFSAWKLRNMTHEEPPWKNTPTGEVISHKALAEFFKTQLA
jgi:hypothetical protein